MSLLVAIPFGVAAGCAYGVATAVQHDAAHTGTGQADARGLLRLVRDPRWLASIGGDSLGLILQIVALSTGPVVLIQPLLVLTLPVSLLAGHLLGGPRPRRGDYLACAAIIGSLSVFLVLVGEPGAGNPLRARDALVTMVALVAGGGLLCLLVRGRAAALRAGVFGGVAGAWFGGISVLLNAAATEFGDHGAQGLFTTANGLVPLLGIAVVGGLGMVLTQVSFQIGALAASFPANKSADPLVAVVLGAALLHQHVPADVPRVTVYLACLAAITLSAVRLATPPSITQAVGHNDGR